ncbi:MAG: hypothetical protein WBS24_13790 [Terriglobales bacterium]
MPDTTKPHALPKESDGGEARYARPEEQEYGDRKEASRSDFCGGIKAGLIIATHLLRKRTAFDLSQSAC